MFNCDKCGRTTKAGEPANKVTVATREKNYRNVVKQKKTPEEENGEERPQRPRRFDRKAIQYHESTGTEIAKEICICNSCAGVVEQPVARSSREPKQLWWSPGSIDGVQVG